MPVTAREAHSPGFMLQIALDSFPFGKFRGSVMVFRISDFPPLWKFIENSGFNQKQKMRHFTQNYKKI